MLPYTRTGSQSGCITAVLCCPPRQTSAAVPTPDAKCARRRRARRAGGVDISMLEEAVRLIGGRVETEASGNVTLDTIGVIAKSGVDFISSGALTHSVKCLDISFNIKVDQA